MTPLISPNQSFYHRSVAFPFASRAVIGVLLPRSSDETKKEELMVFPHVNYLAILVSGVAIFLLGGIWYSVLFKKPWVALMGIPEEKMKEGSGAMPFNFLMAFLCGLAISYIMAIVINHFAPFSVARGAMVGTMIWIGFAAPTSFATAIFSMTKKPLWLINSTYNWLCFVVVGIILSVWR
jgi:hypothetical protein